MKEKIAPSVGLGSEAYTVAFYIANRPPIDEYPEQDCLRPMLKGEVAHIVQHTSNHWRKVFNVLAKFLVELRADTQENFAGSWQQYRDDALFQMHSNEALLFSTPNFAPAKNVVHIITGKTYATEVLKEGEYSIPLTWLDEYFAINGEYRLIVSPYPDYRQLSNERISRLVDIVRSLERK